MEILALPYYSQQGLSVRLWGGGLLRVRSVCVSLSAFSFAL